MTSTNDEKEVEISQTACPKGRSYYIKVYKTLDAALIADGSLRERTEAVCNLWSQVHSLCTHSAPSTHPHLLQWVQRHTATTILKSEWRDPSSEDLHNRLKQYLQAFITDAQSASADRSDWYPWEALLIARAEWFIRVIPDPWGHAVLRRLLDPGDGPPCDDQDIIQWLKEETGIVLVCRLRQLAVSKQCADLALLLVTAVMERMRGAKEKINDSGGTLSFEEELSQNAGFTSEVWETLGDIEFVLLHKLGKTSNCIQLAKVTPLVNSYKLIERLRTRLETSPSEKKLWKNAKDVALLIAEVVVTRCMVCEWGGSVGEWLWGGAVVVSRLVPPAFRRATAAALAAPARTSHHLHVFARAMEATCTEDMNAFVVELYVRAITAGMNELEKLKLNNEKEVEARLHSRTLCNWFQQLSIVVKKSPRLAAECTLTAFSVFASPQLYEKLKAQPVFPPPLKPQQTVTETPSSSFGSWANDSRSQTNLVKTSETLNLEYLTGQTSVLSIAILNEGANIGMSPELCQDLAVLLSGPRVKTLTWDMDRDKLLEHCRVYMERTKCGTKSLKTELRYLNLDPSQYQHLPEEEDEDEDDIYYGIEKGYEHLVDLPPPESPKTEQIWTGLQYSQSSESEYEIMPSKNRNPVISSDDDDDPLSLGIIAAKCKKSRKKDKDQRKEHSKSVENKTGKKVKKERKKRDKNSSKKSNLGKSDTKKQIKGNTTKTNVTDSDYDSQGISSLASLTPEVNDDNIEYDGLFSMEDLNITPPKEVTEILQNPVVNTASKKPQKPRVVKKREPKPKDPVVKELKQSIMPKAPKLKHCPENEKVRNSINKLLMFRKQRNNAPRTNSVHVESQANQDTGLIDKKIEQSFEKQMSNDDVQSFPVKMGTSIVQDIAQNSTSVIKHTLLPAQTITKQNLPNVQTNFVALSKGESIAEYIKQLQTAALEKRINWDKNGTQETFVKSQQPIVKSQQTIAQSQQPIVKSQQTIAQSQQPIVKSQQTIAQSQQPIVKSQQLIVKSQELITKSQQPIVKSQQPIVKSQQMIAQSQQPIVKSQQIIAQSQQPIVRSQQLIVKPQQPIVKSQQTIVQSRQPIVQSQQPIVKSQQTIVQSRQPIVQSQQPIVQSQQPILKPRQSIIQSQQPIVKSQQVVISQQPIVNPLATMLNPRIDTLYQQQQLLNRFEQQHTALNQKQNVVPQLVAIKLQMPVKPAPKVEPVLNTFSRLSYLHKNKHAEPRKTEQQSQIQEFSDELERRISAYKLLKHTIQRSSTQSSPLQPSIGSSKLTPDSKELKDRIDSHLRTMILSPTKPPKAPSTPKPTVFPQSTSQTSPLVKQQLSKHITSKAATQSVHSNLCIDKKVLTQSDKQVPSQAYRSTEESQTQVGNKNKQNLPNKSGNSQLNKDYYAKLLSNNFFDKLSNCGKDKNVVTTNQPCTKTRPQNTTHVPTKTSTLEKQCHDKPKTESLQILSDELVTDIVVNFKRKNKKDSGALQTSSSVRQDLMTQNHSKPVVTAFNPNHIIITAKKASVNVTNPVVSKIKDATKPSKRKSTAAKPKKSSSKAPDKDFSNSYMAYLKKNVFSNQSAKSQLTQNKNTYANKNINDLQEPAYVATKDENQLTDSNWASVLDALRATKTRKENEAILKIQSKSEVTLIKKPISNTKLTTNITKQTTNVTQQPRYVSNTQIKTSNKYLDSINQGNTSNVQSRAQKYKEDEYASIDELIDEDLLQEINYSDIEKPTCAEKFYQAPKVSAPHSSNNTQMIPATSASNVAQSYVPSNTGLISQQYMQNTSVQQTSSNILLATVPIAQKVVIVTPNIVTQNKGYNTSSKLTPEAGITNLINNYLVNNTQNVVYKPQYAPVLNQLYVRNVVIPQVPQVANYIQPTTSIATSPPVTSTICHTGVINSTANEQVIMPKVESINQQPDKEENFHNIPRTPTESDIIIENSIAAEQILMPSIKSNLNIYDVHTTLDTTPVFKNNLTENLNTKTETKPTLQESKLNDSKTNIANTSRDSIKLVPAIDAQENTPEISMKEAVKIAMDSVKREERLQMKRNKLLNRKIHHFSNAKAIALGYQPIAKDLGRKERRRGRKTGSKRLENINIVKPEQPVECRRILLRSSNSLNSDKKITTRVEVETQKRKSKPLIKDLIEASALNKQCNPPKPEMINTEKIMQRENLTNELNKNEPKVDAEPKKNENEEIPLLLECTEEPFEPISYKKPANKNAKYLSSAPKLISPRSIQQIEQAESYKKQVKIDEDKNRIVSGAKDTTEFHYKDTNQEPTKQNTNKITISSSANEDNKCTTVTNIEKTSNNTKTEGIQTISQTNDKTEILKTSIVDNSNCKENNDFDMKDVKIINEEMFISNNRNRTEKHLTLRITNGKTIKVRVSGVNDFDSDAVLNEPALKAYIYKCFNSNQQFKLEVKTGQEGLKVLEEQTNKMETINLLSDDEEKPSEKSVERHNIPLRSSKKREGKVIIPVLKTKIQSQNEKIKQTTSKNDTTNIYDTFITDTSLPAKKINKIETKNQNQSVIKDKVPNLIFGYNPMISDLVGKIIQHEKSKQSCTLNASNVKCDDGCSNLQPEEIKKDASILSDSTILRDSITPELEDITLKTCNFEKDKTTRNEVVTPDELNINEILENQVKLFEQTNTAKKNQVSKENKPCCGAIGQIKRPIKEKTTASASPIQSELPKFSNEIKEDVKTSRKIKPQIKEDTVKTEIQSMTNEQRLLSKKVLDKKPFPLDKTFAMPQVTPKIAFISTDLPKPTKDVKSGFKSNNAKNCDQSIEVIDLVDSSDDETAKENNIIDNLKRDLIKDIIPLLKPTLEINNLKNKLLEEIDTIKEDTGTKHTTARYSSDSKLSSKCFVHLTRCDELAQKYTSVQNSCFINLTKCDDAVVLDSDTEEISAKTENECDNSRSESPSILDFNEDIDVPINDNPKSPIIQVSESLLENVYPINLENVLPSVERCLKRKSESLNAYDGEKSDMKYIDESPKRLKSDVELKTKSIVPEVASDMCVEMNEDKPAQLVSKTESISSLDKNQSDTVLVNASDAVFSCNKMVCLHLTASNKIEDFIEHVEAIAPEIPLEDQPVKCSINENFSIAAEIESTTTLNTALRIDENVGTTETPADVDVEKIDLVEISHNTENSYQEELETQNNDNTVEPICPSEETQKDNSDNVSESCSNSKITPPVEETESTILQVKNVESDIDDPSLKENFVTYKSNERVKADNGNISSFENKTSEQDITDKNLNKNANQEAKSGLPDNTNQSSENEISKQSHDEQSMTTKVISSEGVTKENITAEQLTSIDIDTLVVDTNQNETIDEITPTSEPSNDSLSPVLELDSCVEIMKSGRTGISETEIHYPNKDNEIGHKTNENSETIIESSEVTNPSLLIGPESNKTEIPIDSNIRLPEKLLECKDHNEDQVSGADFENNEKQITETEKPSAITELSDANSSKETSTKNAVNLPNDQNMPVADVGTSDLSTASKRVDEIVKIIPNLPIRHDLNSIFSDENLGTETKISIVDEIQADDNLSQSSIASSISESPTIALSQASNDSNTAKEYVVDINEAEKLSSGCLTPIDEIPGLVIPGIEVIDPDIGKCYIFTPICGSGNPISASAPSSSNDKSIKCDVINISSSINNQEVYEVFEIIDDENENFDITINIPTKTYSSNSINTRKRLHSGKDVQASSKKYRKGKNIDYPKMTLATINQYTYRNDYKRVIEYIDKIKFSFASCFHREYFDVQELQENWPENCKTNDKPIEESSGDSVSIFEDVSTDSKILVPFKDSTLEEEINSVSLETEIPSAEESDNNFSMGFGERSGRVIQNLNEKDNLTISAATLSDVKQYQPSQCENLTDIKIRLNKIQNELTYQMMLFNVKQFFDNYIITCYTKSRSLIERIPGLYETTYMQPVLRPLTVNVVQVGQLPVSAAAQNPVTCDPRVTHVSDASPSQCSVESSPQSHDNHQTNIKAEYTELTTADLSLPLQNMSNLNKAPNEGQNKTKISEQNVIPTHIETESKAPLINDCNAQTTNDNPSSDVSVNNLEYQYETNGNNAKTSPVDPVGDSTKTIYTSTPFKEIENQRKPENSPEKTDQIAHAMNAAGITTSELPVTARTQSFVNIISQKVIRPPLNTLQTNNIYPKSTAINAISLQQALAQILPPPLNQTSNGDGNPQQNVTPQVLHIVHGKNTSGNQITLLDNSQQSVISGSNATQVLHIVQNKGPVTSSQNNVSPQPTTFSGLSLVDAGLQQGGNQLLHIVNTGAQKTNNAGQLLKRVNLLTNLTNMQGGNEQKMVQFVCKSADGKSIHLNAPHQRSMVLRLQPIETPVQPPTTKANEQSNAKPGTTNAQTSAKDDQEIKSRSIYEENYAKFIQNASTKPQTPGTGEQATSLPKFNQAFGKPVFLDDAQKQNDLNVPSVQNAENSDCRSTENAMNIDHISQIGSPPLLLRKQPIVTSQAQPNIVQQIKQTIAPMNIQTMHGGVIYTRQIPVNLGGGQTINLITVPSTEMVDESGQKQPSEVKFITQNEGEPSIIKIVPQTPAPNAEVNQEDGTAHMVTSEGSSQPQPVLTQMRIKLPMLSKAPQVVPGTRVVRPSFFQIQRNVIGGANQPVYQQLVLTAAPTLGQQTIRLPQAQTRIVKGPSETQTSESQLSSSTLEQLREFDMVLEQVKERSTVQPGASPSYAKSHSADTTDGASSSSSTHSEQPQQILYSIGNNQTMNVAYINKKATVTTSSANFVRSPDSSVADSPSSTPVSQVSHDPQSSNESQSKTSRVGSKSVKNKPTKPATHTPSAVKVNHTMPPKTSTQKPLEDEQTTQRILYILAEYKEQVENSPDKDKPAPRRRSNPPTNPSGSSKRKKSSSGSRRPGCTRDHSPLTGDDASRTMGSEDSSCGTSQGDCTESCSIETHSPQDSPRKVARKLFEPESQPATQPRPQPQRNVIVADGQTITVARSATGKPTTAVLMPANYILPVSMVKGGQQIAIVTNRGPKLLTVGGTGESGAANALFLQRLIGPGGLKPVLARPGVRHVRLPTAALHNLQAFNLAASAPQQQADSTASPASAPTPDLVDTRANSSPWTESDAQSDVKMERGSSPEGSEPWNLPSSSDRQDYSYEDSANAKQAAYRTVLDSIPDRYSPDAESQRIFEKMFEVDKKSYIVEGHDDLDASHSDCDDKVYNQVVHNKDGSSRSLHRVTQISAAALRHKYAILEHELRLQKSLSEECEDLGVDSPSASELFPEAELLFAASPADHDGAHHAHPAQQSTHQSAPPHQEPEMNQQLVPRCEPHELSDVGLDLDDDGVVTVSEDGLQAMALDQEEFARSHPNTTFHSEPTDVGVQPFALSSSVKSRHVNPSVYGGPPTVLMTPATVLDSHTRGNPTTHYDIDHIAVTTHNNRELNLSSVLVKDDGLTRFDNILTDSRELHLSNTASAIVHPGSNATQVIRRVCYDDDKRDRYLLDDSEIIAGDDAKMAVAEDSSRDATLGSIGEVDDDASSPERHAELFWESNSASVESRRPLDFSSDSDKCCKSPSLDETNSTDSSGVGTQMRLDSVIKEARARERSASACSSVDETTHPPIRTYPPKRSFHTEEERSLSGKTRAGESSPDNPEVRRRASSRGVVKRGCHCCNGSPAPQRPKKQRQRKPTLDFATNH